MNIVAFPLNRKDVSKPVGFDEQFDNASLKEGFLARFTAGFSLDALSEYTGWTNQTVIRVIKLHPDIDNLERKRLVVELLDGVDAQNSLEYMASQMGLSRDFLAKVYANQNQGVYHRMAYLADRYGVTDEEVLRWILHASVLTDMFEEEVAEFFDEIYPNKLQPMLPTNIRWMRWAAEQMKSIVTVTIK